MSLTKVTYSMVKGAPVNILDFGADPTGATDSTAAIQAALDCIPNGPSSYAPSKPTGGAGEVDVIFPAGNYLVNSCLIVNQRQMQRIIGLGKVFIYSSSTTYVFDMSSTWRCGIENINIVSETAGVGIYMTRCISNPFTDYNEYRNVNVQMNAGITANGGIGTIALYMDRAEQNMFYNCAFNADCSLYNTPVFIAAFPPASGTQDTTTNSNTVNTFIGCNFTKNGSYQFGMILNTCLSFKFYNCYWNDLRITAGAAPYMFRLTSVAECLFQGTFDALIQLALVSGNNLYNNFDLILPTTYMSGSVFSFDIAGVHDFSVSDIKIFTSGSAVSLYLFSQTIGTSSVSIRGNTIKTISDLPLVTGSNITSANNLYFTEGSLNFVGVNVSATAAVTAFSASPPANNGAGNLGLTISSTAQLGVFVGVGAPGISAAKGSLYLNTTGSSTSTRLYVNTDGSGAWTAVTTAT